jgi:histone acetyltransferase HTATIP
LQALGLLKYYKGQYVLCVTSKHLEDYRRSISKQQIIIDPQYLVWTPPVVDRHDTTLKK